MLHAPYIGKHVCGSECGYYIPKGASPIISKEETMGASEIGQWLRALAALAENKSSVLSRGLDALFQPPQAPHTHMVHTHTSRKNTQMHKIIMHKNKEETMKRWHRPNGVPDGHFIIRFSNPKNLEGSLCCGFHNVN